MRIKLLTVGKTKEKYWVAAEQEYETRIRRYVGFSRKDIPDVKKKVSEKELKKIEGDLILKEISDKDFVVLLDNNGKQYSSESFAEFLDEKYKYFPNDLVFIVGGAYGFSEDVYGRANAKMSLSLMTFSHQMVRCIFLEQCYRGFTIINGEPYHHK